MMSVSKPIPKHVVLFSLLIFCMSNSFKLCYSTIVCPEIEKQALLKTKQSLEDPLNILSSWNISREDNCCMWKGVVCNNLTGHVHQLHLQEGLGGKVNPSLLNLKELKYLDLSQNDFGGTIPSFIGLLTSLEYLDLSFSGFVGKIPHNIGNLSNLHTLSLDDYKTFEVVDGEFHSLLDVESMEWLSGLSRLQFLRMNSVNLSRATNWVQVISTLPSLVELHLRSCNLDAMSPLSDVNITSLTILDLSENNFFNSFAIPTWAFQLPSLVELHLSSCGLNFMAPLSDVNSTSLTILDLSNNNFDTFAIPTWVFLLPSLVELHLSSCGLNSMAPLIDVNTTSLTILDISGSHFESFSMLRWIFRQHNLVSLDLRNCDFEGPLPTSSNTTKLKYIDLSFNNINSPIPDWLFFCKDLEYVSMADTFLHNTISNAIGNLTSLNTLDLSVNELSGNIPSEIGSLCKIQTLDLSENKLKGEIPDSFGNKSDCFLTRLYLGENQLSGAIPINLGNLSNLDDLRLDHNKLTGNLPESLGKLFNLAFLSISHNMLEGVVTESHFANLTKLSYLSASENYLSLNVSSDWVPPFKLDKLELGSWDIGTHIPSWIETQRNVMELDLSNTGISGNIPTWFWEIRFLNLSHNNLHGEIPDFSVLEDYIPRLVYLSSNQFSGSLPRVANSVTELDLSNNSFSGGMSHFLCDATNETYRLEILHLGGNQLTGEIPDCLMKWPSLNVLILANNNLSGNIPNSIGSLASLLSLDLHGNMISGKIPFSMHNCTKLLKVDLSSNGLDGNIPAWMGRSLENLKFLILRSTKLSGEIPSNICHLKALQILDLSDNAFSGVIPKCVNNFTAMATKRSFPKLFHRSGELLGYSYHAGYFYESVSVATKGKEYQYDTILSLVTNIDLSNNNLSGDIPKELTSLVELRSLNLSGNHLTGSIPVNMGDMKQLESLDLSRNSLLGEIPNSFTLLFSLSYLDLSFNNLTGRIPTSTQLLGMNASSFLGNDLCGLPLPNTCSNGGSPVEAEEDEGDESKIGWLYIFLSAGYADGLSGCITVLILYKSWREAYFGLLECIWNKIYVYFCIQWTRLTRT